MAEKNQTLNLDNLKKINEILVNKELTAFTDKLSELEKSVKGNKAVFEGKVAHFNELNLAVKKAEQEKKLEAEKKAQELALESKKSTKEQAEKPVEEPIQQVEQVKKAIEEKVEDKKEIKEQVKEEKAVSEVKEEKPTAKPLPSFIVRRNVYEPKKEEVKRPEKPYAKGERKPYGEFKPKDNNGSFNKGAKGENRPSGFKKQQNATYVAPEVIPTGEKSRQDKKKQFTERSYEEKRSSLSKRALIKQSVSVDDFDEDKTGYRKFRPVKKSKEEKATPIIKIERAVINTEIIPLKVLSEKIGITAAEITKRLFKEGIMKTINDSIDFDTAAFIADDLGIELELKVDKTAEDVLNEGFDEGVDSAENLKSRPPVVTVMGHVDHGKTSLLDRLRKTNVTAGEAGGITQHIGAYQVSIGGKVITFLDTPGHAAFTAMRARGAQATDIAILVVAADDGIMPQTVEAINHAKAANVPIIVAVNKIDKPEANIERVKTGLTENGLLPEEWGGDTIVCPVSAKTGEGIDNLLENINLVAEVLELKANPDRKAKGVVIEAKLDNSRGPIATVLIQNGTLREKDSVIVGTVVGKIRAMVDDKGRRVVVATPSTPVSIMGLEEVPETGDILFAGEQEKLIKLVAEERRNKERENMIKSAGKVSLDDVFSKISEGEMKGLNIIVKADVQGSVEAVKQSLEKLSNEEVKVNVIHAAAGAIKESDIMLAESSNAIIIGFNVRPDSNAKIVGERSGVDIKLYRVIYEAIEDVEKALKGMLAPKFTEVYLGKAEVREVFKISGVGQVAGCYVVEGKILRNGKLRIYRDDVMITEGNVLQLKRFKDDVKEVAQGYECGMSIERFNDIKVGDFIECYQVEEDKN